jgi:hypothetical protein
MSRVKVQCLGCGGTHERRLSDLIQRTEAFLSWLMTRTHVSLGETQEGTIGAGSPRAAPCESSLS